MADKLRGSGTFPIVGHLTPAESKAHPLRSAAVPSARRRQELQRKPRSVPDEALASCNGFAVCLLRRSHRYGRCRSRSRRTLRNGGTHRRSSGSRSRRGCRRRIRLRRPFRRRTVNQLGGSDLLFLANVLLPLGVLDVGPEEKRHREKDDQENDNDLQQGECRAWTDGMGGVDGHVNWSRKAGRFRFQAETVAESFERRQPREEAAKRK